MTPYFKINNAAKSLMLFSVATLLSACSAVDRLADVGEMPRQSAIESPTLKPGYQPVALPMPPVKSQEKQFNSLWSAGGQRTFFEDQRADQVGDILTVNIDITDKANLKNETTRDRDSSEDIGAPNFLGFEKYAGKVFPDAVDPANLATIASKSKSGGTGEIKRKEDISLKVAAIVSQVLPNGNMVIQGRQEVRVNYENRILMINGVVRPEDINIDNSISYEKIAEARISYGGKGQLTDVQQPRYGQQVLDIISPF